MELAALNGRLTRQRNKLTSDGLAVASVVVTAVWLLIQGQAAPSRVGTVLVVALPVLGVLHALWRRVGVVRLFIQLCVLAIALFIALYLFAPWPYAT
ncbi:MAG TPA: hypothetical protein VGG74_28560 [Kofleriaceae bacterium]|jgi:hypothetical protein